MFNLRKLKNLDNGFLLIIILLTTIGGLTVFSSTYFFKNSISQLFINQIIFYIVGFLIFFILSTVNLKKINNKFIILSIALASLLLLVLVLFTGNITYGAQRWIEIGSLTIQPSEFAKISIIFIVAYCFTYTKRRELEEIFNIYNLRPRDNVKALKELIISEQFIKFIAGLGFLLISLILILKQKSLGNSVLVTLIFFLTLLSTFRIKIKYLLFLLPIGLSLVLSFNIINFNNIYSRFGINLNLAGFDFVILILSIFVLIITRRIFKLNLIIMILLFLIFLPANYLLNYGYNNLLEPYQRQRIETFIDNSTEKRNELDEDYNRQKAIEAIGSSKLLGKGFLQGNITNSGLLPFAYTDFAYAAYIEQFGFIGGFVLIILYYLLLYKIISIGTKTKNKFSKMIVFGVAIMILLNVTQNIGMNLGILPITGVPLPLISSGGSAVIVVFIGLGLVNSVNLSNKERNSQIIKVNMD